MDNFYLNEIVAEVAPLIVGRRLTRIALEAGGLRLEFGGPRFGLVARLTGDDPALYIASDESGKRTKRRAEAEADAYWSPSGQQLLLQIRSKLVGAAFTSIDKDDYDRVVRISLNAPDWSGAPGIDFKLILFLTGRSVNVLLVGPGPGFPGTPGFQPAPALPGGPGAAGFQPAPVILAALKEAGPIQIGKPPPPARPGAFDPQHALAALDEELTSDQVLESYFGRSSPFSKLHEKEFLSRCRARSPSLAFRTLLDDLFNNKRRPIIYSRLPLNDVAPGAITRDSGSAPEMILSCIELTLADGWRRYEFASFSEAARIYSESLAQAKAVRARYARLSSALEARIKKLHAALHSIESDLARFGEADKLKRSGDLLLANLSTARVEGAIARVKDYYEPEEPEVGIEIPEDQTLQQAAASYYERYRKATRALKTLVPREKEIRAQLRRTEEFLSRLREQPDLQRIEEVEVRSRLPMVGARSRSAPKSATEGTPNRSAKARRSRAPEIGRRFMSSDGLEIVVGRNDTENDAITFRIAGSLDIWLHASDYPGSHVVIRNPSRQAVPQRSIIEAARIAAFYSQARRQGKAAVNYTQKKFVTKPPRAKPGLVRLSSYKTLLVEPTVPPGLDRQNREG